MSEAKVIKAKRTIRFRAWAKDTKEMIPWKEFFTEWFTDKHIVMMQELPIRDMKNKIVYEGDIVKNIVGDVGYVYFDDSHAAFMFCYKNAPQVMFMDDADKDFEVVGNVYEHANLLK